MPIRSQSCTCLFSQIRAEKPSCNLTVGLSLSIWRLGAQRTAEQMNNGPARRKAPRERLHGENSFIKPLATPRVHHHSLPRSRRVRAARLTEGKLRVVGDGRHVVREAVREPAPGRCVGAAEARAAAAVRGAAAGAVGAGAAGVGDSLA